ncbi:hypothetical protein CLOP_g11537 [Closterium sp. NIES-67]|nr:hypothetical protein CLOP_g11537 [Closterium sp. NIES-67]
MARSRHAAVIRPPCLVLAALAALMLSACAPRAAAVRLPATSNAADHSCVIRSCGANAFCVKKRGDATCVCNVGFSMASTGCVDTCELKACGGDGTCTKNDAGVASCVCDTGFVLQADGRTCTDTCELKACGGNGTCTKNAAGVASCVCDTGFVLQADGRTCTDTCELKACGGNGTCTKNAAGVASCVCDAGFVLQPDGTTCAGMCCCVLPDGWTCTDTCELKHCGGNGTCVKSSTTGEATCVCDTGFVLQADGRTCTETCSTCDGNHECVEDDAGAISCVCKYQMVSGACVGPASCGTCPAGATCTPAPYTRTAYCICPPGYGMTDTGCILDATPTVSSTSFTFYMLPWFGITPATYTVRVTLTGCTNLAAESASDIQSYAAAVRAPGGAGDCSEIYAYDEAGCTGAYDVFAGLLTGSGISTWSIPNCIGFPYRSFICVH